MDDDSEREGRYVLPALPEKLGIDPLLAALLHLASFVELSGEEVLDFDWSLEASEHVRYYLLDRMSAEKRAELREQLKVIASFVRRKQKDAEADQFIREFVDEFGEEE